MLFWAVCMGHGLVYKLMSTWSECWFTLNSLKCVNKSMHLRLVLCLMQGEWVWDCVRFVRNSRWHVFCPFLMQSQAASVDHITDAIFMQKICYLGNRERKACELGSREGDARQTKCNTHGYDWSFDKKRWLCPLRRWNALTDKFRWHWERLSLTFAFQHFHLGSCVIILEPWLIAKPMWAEIVSPNWIDHQT